MTREEALVRSLVQMADTLVDDYDVIDLLTGLTDRCVHLLGATAAGVMLASPDGDLRLVASSSEAMRVVEVFELQHREGPCLDAFREGETVTARMLEREGRRWPVFASAALDAGFHSVAALPLRLRDTKVGVLNLFHTGPHLLDEADVLVARAFADLAAISVLHHRSAAEAQRLNEQLTHALASRVVIEQAKGVLAERAGIEMSDAFGRLRRYARRHNLRLSDVAQAAIDGTLDAGAWTDEG